MLLTENVRIFRGSVVTQPRSYVKVGQAVQPFKL